VLHSTWGYNLIDIVRSLESYCARNDLDPQTTAVWICFACINQHRVIEQTENVPPEAFREEFEARVMGTGHVLSMLAPWSKPANLERIWVSFCLFTRAGNGLDDGCWQCLYEVLVGLTLKLKQACKFEVIMPPCEEASFRKALVSDFDSILKSLSQIDLENAEASVVEDKVMIKEIVRQGMGFQAVNKAVMGMLHEWLAATAKAALDALPQAERGTSALINNLGALYQDQGKYQLAEQLYVESMGARRATLGDQHPDTLISIGNLGDLYMDQGKLELAEPLCVEALGAKRATFGDQHPLTLTSIGNLGALYKKQGKYDLAEPLYVESMGASRATLGDQHPRTLASIGNLGVLYQDQGKHQLAEPLCVEALDGKRATLGDKHPSTLASIGNLVDLLREAGKLAEAQATLGNAVATAAEVLGERHPLAIGTAAKAARLRHAQDGGAVEGKAMLSAAVAQMAEVLGAEHPQTLKYAAVLGAMGSEANG